MINVLGCHKEPDPPAGTPAKTDNISASAWKYDNGGIDQDRNGTVDIQASAVFSACALDNTISFKRDNTGITDEGASKCNAADPQTAAFNWNFADAEANLVMSNNIFSLLNGKFKIVTLSPTSFSLTKDTVISLLSPQPVSLIVNLKH